MLYEEPSSTQKYHKRSQIFWYKTIYKHSWPWVWLSVIDMEQIYAARHVKAIFRI